MLSHKWKDRVAAFIGVAALLAVVYLVVRDHLQSHQGMPDAIVSFLILAVAAATLYIAWPRAARLVVIKPDELEVTDLIFFEDADDSPAFDYMLQLHVAVANVGNRKGILSKIRIDGFINDTGRKLVLPLGPSMIEGATWTRRSGFVNFARHDENLAEYPPLVLEGDDVIVMRFRQRRGIDWSPAWDLDELQQLRDVFRRPVVKAYGIIIWRAGEKVQTDTFEVAVTCEGQPLWLQRLDGVTEDMTVRPPFEHRNVPME
jgi:hypothetical protein